MECVTWMVPLSTRGQQQSGNATTSPTPVMSVISHTITSPQSHATLYHTHAHMHIHTHIATALVNEKKQSESRARQQN